MSIGFIGYVMKNNIQITEFPCTVTTLADGSQRVTYDAYDFIGLKGIRRRRANRLFLKKKTFPITKVFRYSDDWDTLTDKGCISYWDQTSQAQIPVKVLNDPAEYKKVVDRQKTASDVLYYCLDGDALIDKLMTPPKVVSFKDFILPSLLIGGIIMTSVMNVYASSQYLQAWGVIKGTAGALGSLQNYFMKIGGLPINMILPPFLPGLLISKNKEKEKKPRGIKPYDNVNILIKQKGLVTNKLTVPIYRENVNLKDGTQATVDYIILEDKRRRFKLYVQTGDKHVLKGINTATLFIKYKEYEKMPFEQLSLADMNMTSEQSQPPINEDMGKVLSKIYQDNINAKAAPQTMIAGLTKILFYTFIFSIGVYAAMFFINLILEGMAISAFNSASAAINTFIAHMSLYRIAPVTNST